MSETILQGAVVENITKPNPIPGSVIVMSRDAREYLTQMDELFSKEEDLKTFGFEHAAAVFREVTFEEWS